MNSTVLPRWLGCRFRLGTALISDARRASAEVNGKQLVELNDGWSLVHTSRFCVLWGLREIVCSEDVLVTRKVAYPPKAFSRSLACCRSLVCIAELFANLVEGDDSPGLGLTGVIFLFLGSRIFSGGPWKLYPRVHYVTVVRWEANYVNMILSS